MKNNKTLSEDEILVEMLREGEERLVKELQELINSCRHEGRIPIS